MDKSRLTITLDPEVLKKLDEDIDGSRIRNRSHAIEYILSKHFAPKVGKALILAGGKSMKVGSKIVPKGMIEINHRPTLEHIIENLRRYDVRDIYISVGMQGETIKKHFGDGAKFGVKISYLDQGSAQTGTAQPVLQAKPYLQDQPFLLFYGDVLAHIDLEDMADFHLSHNGTMTMALTAVNRSSAWGVVRVQGPRVYSFLEKPDQRRDLSNIINAGVYICNPDIFDYLSSAKRLEKDVFPKLVSKRKLFGYIFADEWFDVGDSNSYAKAVKDWKG